MKLRFLGDVVKSIPTTIVIIIILLTGMFFVMMEGMQTQVDIEHYLPDIEEIKAENYISDVFSTGGTDSLQIVIIGDVLNNSVMVEFYNIEKNISEDDRVAGVFSYVDLIINAYILYNILQNISDYGSEFLNMSINFTDMENMLSIIENITKNYNASVGSGVQFCTDNLLRTFVEMHNITIFMENTSMNITIYIPSFEGSYYEKGQDAMYLHNQLEWYSITINAGYQMLNTTSPDYRGEIANWSLVKKSVEEDDNQTARKILNDMRNSTQENLTYMKLGWNFVFGPYNTSLTNLYENISQGILNDELLRYAHQNTTKNIKIMDMMQNMSGWNTTYVKYMLEKYDENVTTIWEKYNQSDVEEYMINTVEYETKYLIENYTMQMYSMMISLQKDLEFIDDILNSLDNSSVPKSEVLSKIDWKIEELNKEMCEFSQIVKMIEDARNFFSLPMFLYLKRGLGDYYLVMVGGYSDDEKKYVDDMFQNISAFFTIGMNMSYGMNNSYGGNFTLNMSFEFPEYNGTEILRNVSVGNLLLNLENLNKTYYHELINRSAEKLSNITEEMKRIDERLRNITYVLSSAEVYTEPAFKIYEEQRISVEENITTMDKFSDYLPNIHNIVDSTDDISQGIKDMLSNDFDYNSASASLAIFQISWAPFNDSTEEMASYQEKIIDYISNNMKKYGVRVRGLSSSLIDEDLYPLLYEVRDRILPLAMALVIIIMGLVFRSALDTFIVLIGVVMAIVWMNGTAVLLGIPMDQLTVVPTALIVGLGVDFGIHMIMRYREYIRSGHKVRKAAGMSVESVGMALALAAITTVIAFLSNLTSPLPPLQNFGIMCALGIVYSFIIMSTFVPAVKILVDRRREKKGKPVVRGGSDASGVKAINTLFEGIAKVSEKHHFVVIGVVILLVGLGIYSHTQVPLTFNLEDFLPEGYSTTKTIKYLENNFNASSTSYAYVLYRGNITAETLKEIDRFMDELKDDEHVVYTQSDSLTTYIKNWMLYNSTFREICEDEDGDLLPDKNVSFALFWLYEHDYENASKYYPVTLNSTVINVKVLAVSSADMKAVYDELRDDAKVIKTGDVVITGAPILTYIITDGLRKSMWNSVLMTMVISAILLFIVFFILTRSLTIGLLTGIPVAVVLTWVFLTMYIGGYAFNVLTVTILALTIGMGIDYSIHISHRFIEEYLGEGRDYQESSLRAVRYTGSALMGSALTSMSGFGALILSSMPPIRVFGILSSLTILYSLLAAIVLLPSMLIVWAKFRERR